MTKNKFKYIRCYPSNFLSRSPFFLRNFILRTIFQKYLRETVFFWFAAALQIKTNIKQI